MPYVREVVNSQVKFSLLGEVSTGSEFLAKRLREYRKLADLTQEQAAAALGITFKYYQRLERQSGIEGVRLSTLEQICEGYRITLEQFFSRAAVKPRLKQRPNSPPHRKAPKR
ncbi:MAG: hypothetical protein B9S32_03725 [Verrucomicrobia bacterium Tous-C9LFEB]|nr:MAG: hypothetical protein B9S32_03725 [Verrucomicrobia bacterium Tous-C9LFEB]